MLAVQTLVEAAVDQEDPAENGGTGGSGIVIVKELNKASGSWPLRAQFSAKKQGTWPEFLVDVDFDYLVVAGGGGGGFNGGGGGGAGGYRTSFPGGTKITLSTGIHTIVVGGGGTACAGGSGVTAGSPSTFSTITSTGGGGGGRLATPRKSRWPWRIRWWWWNCLSI
jgi:hypothetical protein